MLEENQQMDDNVEHLQAYYNMLKEQGYSEQQISRIIQQELNNQQESFLKNNNDNQHHQDYYQEDQNQHVYDQEESQEHDYNKYNQKLELNDYNNQVRQYDKDNFLIKPHIEEEEYEEEQEEQENYDYGILRNSKDQQKYQQQSNNNMIYNKQNLQNPIENQRGVLQEKNVQNIQNRKQSIDKQSERNSVMNKYQSKDNISRGSISSSLNNDSMQQFAPLRNSERISTQTDEKMKQNTIKPSYQGQIDNRLINQKQDSLQTTLKHPIQKNQRVNTNNDENRFNSSTANFIRESYQAKTQIKTNQNENQKIEVRSRSKTPTKIQKPVKVVSVEEKQLLDLKNKLRTIFTFYVSFGDRINVNYLKSNKFHKMMSDAQLKDNTILTQNRLDLMFVKENHNKHNMDFDTFLNLIAKIAALKFPQFNQAQALQMILQNHFLPLYDNIMAETDLGEDELKFKEPIDESPFIILKEVYPILSQIYQHYFAFEWRNKGNEIQVKQKSENGIFQFLKEFDICPSLITKSSAFLLYREILQTDNSDLSRNTQLKDLSFFLQEDQGQCFTFWKFGVYLIRIGNICYQNLFNQLEQPVEGANRTAAEKFAFLLERMELSAGFQNLDKKNQSHQSLIIKKKMLNRMLSNGSISGSCQISSINNNTSSLLQNSTQNQSHIKFPSQMNAQHSGLISGMSSEIDGNSNIMSNFENGSVQSHNSMSRITRSKSDLRLRQSMNGLTEVQQQCIRNYSPMVFVNNQQILNEQQRQVLIAHIKNMQNYKLFKNPMGLVDIQCVENISLIDTHADILLTIFQTYCSFGDAMNTQWMKSSKFTKLMREANIISSNNIPNNNTNHTGMTNNSSSTTNLHFNLKSTEENGKYLTPSDVDLIFIKASKKRSTHSISNAASIDSSIKQQQRLDFEQFLISLEMTAIKLFKELGQHESMINLLNNYILPLLNNLNTTTNKNSQSTQNKSIHSSTHNEHVQILMDILKDQEVVELLGLIHKSMMTYYKYYSQNKNTIDFDKFVRFSKDFGIFPDMIPKHRLLKIFNTLAQIYNTTEIAQSQNSSIEKPVIDQHLFIEAIALCAFEVQYSDPQPNEIEKICYLIERINQSGGQTMIQKQIGHTRSQSNSSGGWDIIQPIRKRYPQYFSHNSSNQFNQNVSSYQNQHQWSENGNEIHSQKISSNAPKYNLFDDIMKKNLQNQYK